METSSNNNTNSSNSGVIVVNERKPLQGIKLENPFTFKAFQVFTGFGFGCGVGIGVGRPVNMGALPMVGQVMSATRGATDAFSGVSRHVNSALRKVGAKNIEVGLGCGVGFGHGFGVGLAVKPGVVQKIQVALIQAMTKLMTKFGISQNLPIAQNALPTSLQNGISTINNQSNQSPYGDITHLMPKLPDQTSQGLQGYGSVNPYSTYGASASKTSSVDMDFARTEKVLTNFLRNPMLREDSTRLETAGRLQSENNILQMVLKHQQVIEELVKENEKLRQILLEDLKIPQSKIESCYLNKNEPPCITCFECRRKQRKR